MVKVIEDEGLRTLIVMIPRPIAGEEYLAVGSVDSILEQAGMKRRDFDGLADSREQEAKPWYAPRLISLVNRD